LTNPVTLFKVTSPHQPAAHCCQALPAFATQLGVNGAGYAHKSAKQRPEFQWGNRFVLLAKLTARCRVVV